MFENENIRDNRTNTELVINALGELATTEISKTENPQGFRKIKLLQEMVEVLQVMF